MDPLKSCWVAFFYLVAVPFAYAWDGASRLYWWLKGKPRPKG